MGLRCTGARTIRDVTDEETRGRQGYHVRSIGKSWATRYNYLLSKLEGAAGDSLLVRRAILLSHDLGRPVLWFWHQRKRPRVIPWLDAFFGQKDSSQSLVRTLQSPSLSCPRMGLEQLKMGWIV